MKGIDIIERKIKLLKSLGFENNQILTIVAQLNQNVYNILDLIDNDKLLGFDDKED